MANIIIRSDSEFGIKRIKHRIERIEKQILPLKLLKEQGTITIYGARELGLLQGELGVFKDLENKWENDSDLDVAQIPDFDPDDDTEFVCPWCDNKVYYNPITAVKFCSKCGHPVKWKEND